MKVSRPLQHDPPRPPDTRHDDDAARITATTISTIIIILYIVSIRQNFHLSTNSPFDRKPIPCHAIGNSVKVICFVRCLLSSQTICWNFCYGWYVMSSRNSVWRCMGVISIRTYLYISLYWMPTKGFGICEKGDLYIWADTAEEWRVWCVEYSGGDKTESFHLIT